MKNIYKSIIAALLALSVSGCTPFLDMDPSDSVSDKVIWESTANAEYHINYIYTYIYRHIRTCNLLYTYIYICTSEKVRRFSEF